MYRKKGGKKGWAVAGDGGELGWAITGDGQKHARGRQKG